jgi:glucose/arabinose dehydrogenase
MRRRHLLAGATGIAAALAAAPGTAGAARRGSTALAPTTVATGLDTPWNLAFLPDGTGLVTERSTARILSLSPTGQLTEVQRLTQDVRPRGEGGLLGLAVSPTYATDRLVYVYYTTATDNRIGRMQLGQRPQPIRTGIPAAGVHNGGRIGFGPDGHLYAGTGDAGRTALAQDRTSLGGKILRITTTGAPAPGNPFANSPVWSLGHRNVQGLAWDATGRMYAAEFGQNRYDELNRIEPGGNYGWPTVEGRSTDPRFTNPLVQWTTAEASPSGIAIRGRSVFVACLRGAKIFRVQLPGDGGGAGTPQALYSGQFGRLRQVVVGPDATLYALTSNRDGRGTPRPGDDRILRLDL